MCPSFFLQGHPLHSADAILASGVWGFISVGAEWFAVLTGPESCNLPKWKAAEELEKFPKTMCKIWGFFLGLTRTWGFPLCDWNIYFFKAFNFLVSWWHFFPPGLIFLTTSDDCNFILYFQFFFPQALLISWGHTIFAITLNKQKFQNFWERLVQLLLNNIPHKDTTESVVWARYL